MVRIDRGSRERMERESASSLSAQALGLQAMVRRTGVILDRVLTLVATCCRSDDDVAKAETLRDELKPLIDALIHFEVPR